MYDPSITNTLYLSGHGFACYLETSETYEDKDTVYFDDLVRALRTHNTTLNAYGRRSIYFSYVVLDTCCNATLSSALILKSITRYIVGCTMSMTYHGFINGEVDMYKMIDKYISFNKDKKTDAVLLCTDKAKELNSIIQYIAKKYNQHITTPTSAALWVEYSGEINPNLYDLYECVKSTLGISDVDTELTTKETRLWKKMIKLFKSVSIYYKQTKQNDMCHGSGAVTSLNLLGGFKQAESKYQLPKQIREEIRVRYRGSFGHHIHMI